ncbi:MAG: alpha/beta hydrolase [Flavobacteriales bacterium]
MRTLPLCLYCFLFCSCLTFAQKKKEIVACPTEQKTTHGKLESYLIPFGDSSSRQVLIWLPKNYNPTVKYATIYMHDGQMLFDSTTTWNKKEWRVDETSDSLISNGITRPFIVVGIYNDPPNRYAEFFPEKTIEYMDTAYVRKLNKNLWNGELRADAYLDWICQQLIPFVQKTYSVSHKRTDRFLIGSSMGGLISLYGLSEKTNYFGGAACLSIHTPMINFQMIGDDAMNQLVLPFNQYLSKQLPSPKKVILYLDRGTETLDAYYGPYHEVLLKTVENHGYQVGPKFLSLVWEKTAHDEVSWANRLAFPMKFLLIKE